MKILLTIYLLELVKILLFLLYCYARCSINLFIGQMNFDQINF